MASAFAKIAFTPSVQAAQARMGSRDTYREAEVGDPECVELGPHEVEFIRGRDSFYQGTVAENGWPYVQHRGGPAGFLKVLDARTIGYGDFSGNRQYISVGNLDGNDRVSLILMDYPGQRRLKIWGRTRLIDEETAPALMAGLECPDYRARVERGVVIRVEAFDWNCPKYITPRFTKREIEALALGSRGDGATREPATGIVGDIGSGALKLVVGGIRQLTPQVWGYELRAPDWGELPAFTAGAHLAVPVRLADGSLITRQYSLAGNPRRRDKYEIAVLREETGRGSSAIHATWQVGTGLAVDHPVNQFPLHDDDRPAVLIAGGIGITPILAMAHELKARGTVFELHYSGRHYNDMAYWDRLAREFPRQLRLYFTRFPGGTRMDLRRVMCAAPADALFYVCGPGGMIAAVEALARELSLTTGRVRYESFE